MLCHVMLVCTAWCPAPGEPNVFVYYKRQLSISSGSTLGREEAQAPQIVASLPNLAVLSTHCGQLTVRKISKPDATRCQILYG